MALSEQQLNMIGTKSREILEMKYYNQAYKNGIRNANLICTSPIYIDKRYVDLDPIFSSIVENNIHESILHVYIYNGNMISYKSINLLIEPIITDVENDVYRYRYLMIDVDTGVMMPFDENRIDHSRYLIAEREIVNVVLKSKIDDITLKDNFFCHGVRMLNPFMVQEVIERVKSKYSGAEGFWSYNRFDNSLTKDIPDQNKLFNLFLIPVSIMNNLFRSLVLRGVLEDLPEDFFIERSPTLNYDRNLYNPYRECNNGALLTILGGNGGIIRQSKYKKLLIPQSISFTMSRSSFVTLDLTFTNHDKAIGFVQRVSKDDDGAIIHVCLVNDTTHPNITRYHNDQNGFVYNHAIRFTCTDLRMIPNHGEPNDGYISDKIIPDFLVDINNSEISDSITDTNSPYRTFVPDDILSKLGGNLSLRKGDLSNIRVHFVINEPNGGGLSNNSVRNNPSVFTTSMLYKYNPGYTNLYTTDHIHNGNLITYGIEREAIGNHEEIKATVNEHIGVDVYARRLSIHDMMINKLIAGRYPIQVDDRYSYLPFGSKVIKPYYYDVGLGNYANYCGVFSRNYYGGLNDFYTVGSNINIKAVEKYQNRSRGLPEITSINDYYRFRKTYKEGSAEFVYFDYGDRKIIPVGVGYFTHFDTESGNESTMYRGTRSVYSAMHIGNKEMPRDRYDPSSTNRPRSIMLDSIVYTIGTDYGHGLGIDGTYPGTERNMIEVETYEATRSCRGLYIGKDERLINGNHNVVMTTLPERYPFSVDDCKVYTDPVGTRTSATVTNGVLYTKFDDVFKLTNSRAHNSYFSKDVWEVKTPIYYTPYGKLDIMEDSKGRMKSVYGYNQIMLFGHDQFKVSRSYSDMYINLWSYSSIYGYTKTYNDIVSGDIDQKKFIKKPLHYSNEYILEIMRLPGAICNYIDKISSHGRLNNCIGAYSDVARLTEGNGNTLRNDVVNVLLKSAVAHRSTNRMYTDLLDYRIKYLCSESVYKTNSVTPSSYALTSNNEGHIDIYLPLFYFATSHRTYIFNVDSYFLVDLDMSNIAMHIKNDQRMRIHISLVAFNGVNNTVIFQDTHQQRPNNNPATTHVSELKRKPTIEIVIRNAGDISAKVDFSLLANFYPVEKHSNLLMIRNPHLIRVSDNIRHGNNMDDLMSEQPGHDIISSRYDVELRSKLSSDSKDAIRNEYSFDFYTESVWGDERVRSHAESVYPTFLSKFAEYYNSISNLFS